MTVTYYTDHQRRSVMRKVTDFKAADPTRTFYAHSATHAWIEDWEVISVIDGTGGSAVAHPIEQEEALALLRSFGAAPDGLDV